MPGAVERNARRIRVVTAAVVAVVAVVAAVLLATRPSARPLAPAPLSAVAAAAPASLVAAADGIHYFASVEPGTGVIESRPATSAPALLNPNLLAVGTQAPGFTLETPAGAPVSLASTRGSAVLLEFFATWCPHCVAETPHLRQLYVSLQAAHAKVAFLEVDADGETAPSVYAYERYFALPFPVLLDPSAQPGSFTAQGAPGVVTTAYQVADYPTFYVLDTRGAIVWRGDGEQPDALLRLVLSAAQSNG